MKLKKRIWIINQFACTPDMPGGSRHHEIASFLVKKGLEVDIFASDYNLSRRKFLRLNKIELIKNEINQGVNWYWLKTFPYKINNWKRYVNLLSFSLTFLSFNFYKAIICLKNNFLPDLIIGSSPQIISSFCGLILAKVIKKPFIFEVRDLWPQVLVDLGGLDKKNILIRILSLIEFLLYQNSDYIIVLAEGAKSYVKKRGAKNIIWLPNGPDLEKFKYVNQFNLNKTFCKENPFTIIYAGAHGKANDLENVINASKILHGYPIKLLLIGDGPEKNDLILKAKNLKNIVFKKPISKKLIPKILSSADAILISLGNVELFQYGISPNKLYDAYALGKPVISTLRGSVNDEIKRNNLGLVCNPGDPNALAKIIREMYELPNIERKKMGFNGRKLAESIYSRDIINNRYFDLLQNLLKEND